MLRKKLTFVVFIFLFATSLFGQKKTVVLSLSYFQPYCGGARPTKEMQEEAAKPKPYSNKAVVIVSETGKADSVKTNATGRIKIRLKKGTYKLYEAWRYYKSTANGEAKTNYDEECLKNEWKNETYLITVTKKGYELKEVNQIINNCDWNTPCIKNGSKQIPD